MRWTIAFVALLLGLGALGWFAGAVLAPGGSSAAPVAASSLTCSVKDTECNTGAGEVAVFRMSSLANAHAEVPGGSTYGKVVCCGGVAGLGNSCSGVYDTVLTLSGTGNAHVASDASYGTEACLSAGTAVVQCVFAGSCAAGYACLATASATDNAHVADCNGTDDYATKVCCYAGDPFNTPEGTNVVVPLNGGLDVIGGLEVTFPTVSTAGNTTVTTSTGGPSPPTGYEIVGVAGQPTYYDINTTATYSTPVTVCIKYDETEVGGQESDLKLMHRVGDVWEDITKPPPPPNPDVANDIICGETATLSVFAVMEAPPAVGGIAELPEVAERSDSRAGIYGLAGGLAAAVVALTAGGWYARRRWLSTRR